MSKSPVKICVTGAAGLISYSLVPMIASGEVFGRDQPVILSLLDIEPCVNGLKGLVMELEDCVYPLVVEVIATTNTEVAFKDVDYCVLCGAFPRKQGMERKDLLAKNAGIFREQGVAIKKFAKSTVKCLVVGNPANTNAFLLRHYGDLPKTAVTALTRLDQNRASGMISRRAKVPILNVRNVIIWGNHSATQFADVNHATVTQLDGSVASVRSAINDDAFLDGPLITDVQQRGAKVIATRGSSSATSAARAIADHMRDWYSGTKDGEYVSMGVWSDGNPYGVPEGLVYSFPVVCKDGEFTIVPGLDISEVSRKFLNATAEELLQEREQAIEVTKEN